MLAATLELLEERGFEQMELPEVARRAAVHPTTVYRRWGTKARLVGEALLERARPLSSTPDTGSLRTDLERLLEEGAALLQTPPVLGLFEVLLGQRAHPSPEVLRARDRFWAAHLEEVRRIVGRALARSEVPTDTDPLALVELVIGPALVRALLMGRGLSPADGEAVVARALAALSSAGAAPPPRPGA